MRFRIKALDEVTTPRTYSDQFYFELYDYYDLESGEPVPDKIKNLPPMNTSLGTIVKIDYPIINNIFTLAGRKGLHDKYVEAGKKAFVRNGNYTHPVKNWKSSIEEWSPMKYVEECLKILQYRGAGFKSPEELIEFKSKYYDFNILASFAGNLNYPAIDYRDNQQEGLHRAIFAMNEGLNSIPVIVIKPVKR